MASKKGKRRKGQGGNPSAKKRQSAPVTAPANNEDKPDGVRKSWMDQVMTRRGAMIAAGTGVVALYAAWKFWPASDRNIRKIDVKTSWRESMELNFEDKDLQKHVETALDYIESHEFPYDYKETQYSKVQHAYYSGQELIQRIQDNIEKVRKQRPSSLSSDGKIVLTDKLPVELNELKKQIASIPVRLSDGSYTVSRIILGNESLKKGRYQARNGNYYPVSVMQALVNELTHAAYGISDLQSERIEQIITLPLGGYPAAFLRGSGPFKGKVLTFDRTDDTYFTLLSENGTPYVDLPEAQRPQTLKSDYKPK